MVQHSTLGGSIIKPVHHFCFWPWYCKMGHFLFPLYCFLDREHEACVMEDIIHHAIIQTLMSTKDSDLFIPVLKLCKHVWLSCSHEVLLNSKPPWPTHHCLSHCFHHGDQSTTRWGEKSTNEGWEEWWNTQTHTHIPVDDSSIIDRVVEINRVSRQVHLFSCWSVVRHKTVCKTKRIIHLWD